MKNRAFLSVDRNICKWMTMSSSVCSEVRLVNPTSRHFQVPSGSSLSGNFTESQNVIDITQLAAVQTITLVLSSNKMIRDTYSPHLPTTPTPK